MSYLADRGRYTWILDSNDPFTRRNTIAVVFLACKHPRSPRTTFYLRQADTVSGLNSGYFLKYSDFGRSKEQTKQTTRINCVLFGNKYWAKNRVLSERLR